MNIGSRAQAFQFHLTKSERVENPKLAWSTLGKVRFRGFAYSKSVDKPFVSLGEHFAAVIDFDDFVKRVTDLNGYFAVIIDLEDHILAAVDRVSSTSLMYRNGILFEVGDSYREFLETEHTISPVGVSQFLASGYAHGANTLVEGVNQLYAGSALCFQKSTRQLTVKEYFRYQQDDRAVSSSVPDLHAELQDVHLKVFSRMVGSLGGRQAVVPLSGGYDSRLIVEMLRLFEYDNVLCVTWGREDFWEVQIARDVATALGFPWIRVDTSAAEWRGWYQSGAIDAQISACGGIGTIPYIQDNLIFQKLQSAGLLQDDAIFISGNSGDFVEGGHAYPSAEPENSELLVDRLIRQHMRLLPVRHVGEATQSIRDDISRYRDQFGTIQGFDEFWEWRERQSKFVSKSIKSFETHGFEWRMPFWDLEIMDFWRSIPRELKMGRKLFYDYAAEYMVQRTPPANPARPKFHHYLNWLKDGRYGFYCSPDHPVLSRMKMNSSLVDAKLGRFFKARPVGSTFINGLIALDACNRALATVGK